MVVSCCIVDSEASNLNYIRPQTVQHLRIGCVGSDSSQHLA